MDNLVYILPYLRKGIINNIENTRDDVVGKKRAKVEVGVRFQKKAINSDTLVQHDIKGHDIELLGPSDVKGISLNAIIRTSPAQTGDVRMNASYMPYMEFYEEDLPWRYTPFATSSKNFYPWMRLIAVKKEEYSISFRNGIKVATLTLSQERIAEVFPDMAVNGNKRKTADLKKTAHVQIDVPDNLPSGKFNEEYVNKVLDENPDCGISRVVCPSKLEPDTQYVVLLIPTYEQGRLAGLGQEAGGVNMDVLVCPKADTPIEVPCYYKWKLTTAKENGTFKELANMLTPADNKGMEANLTVDISQSGLQTVNYREEKEIDVPAALVMDEKPYANLKVEDKDDGGKDYREELHKHLLLNPVFDDNEGESANKDEDPWVVPPVYGARHLMTTRNDFPVNADKNVVTEVNLKLHNRIPAGMGSSVVKKNQESFVNRAWKKVEVVNACNQQLREYCQMKSVSECSKKKNVRTTFRQQVEEKKLNITGRNKGLFSDAALRMLQTSGIYYDHVDSNTMHEAFDNVLNNEKDNGIISAGITGDFLLEMYAPEEWQEMIDKDLRYDYLDDVYNKENAFEQVEELKCVSFLSGMFDTKKTSEEARFVKKSKVDFNTKKSSTIFDNQNFFDIISVMTSPSNPIKMDNVYDVLSKLKDDYATFDERRLSTLKIGEINGHNPLCYYPIDVVNNSSYDTYIYIVDDRYYADICINEEKLGSKPLAIKYYENQRPKDEEGNEVEKAKDIAHYLILVPKTYLNGITDAKYYTSFMDSDLQLQRNGDSFSFDSYNFFSIKGLPNNFNPKWCALYKQVEYNYWWMSNHCPAYYSTDKVSSKKHETKGEDPNLQLRFYDNRFQTSLSGKKYHWLEWNNYSQVNTFGSYYNNGKGFRLIATSYRNILKEMLECMERIPMLMVQPSKVEFKLEPESCTMISADDFFKASLERSQEMDAEDLEAFKNDLHKLISNTIKNQNEEIKKILKVETDEMKSGNVNTDMESSLDIGDKEKSLQEVIDELTVKYGNTEYGQIERRLNDKYPVMIHPDYLEPTYFYLRELSVDYILPSAGSLGKNTISCFYSNAAFEEAFLMGMNTEMGRELMWREYPTDQRGSYFRKFWQQTQLPEKNKLEESYYDVNDLDKWGKPLGKNHKEGKGGMLVLAIKGQLMQTYPDTEVFLDSLNGNRIDPVMTSWLTGDTYLVGFSGLKKKELAKYYLVFNQKPLSLQFSEEMIDDKKNKYGIVNPQCVYMKAIN